MALKYFLEYRDTQNILFRAEIRQEGYEGDPIEIRGYCDLEYPEIDDIYTVIRGSGMRINLEATKDLTLEDLYSEEEKTFAVKLERDGQVIFRGFIDPSGLFEDLVNNVWEVSLDCVDGLALLENLSYVDDEGFPFIGRASDLEVIDRCLNRTGILSDTGQKLLLETSINTRYRGLPITLDPISNVHSNQERFYRDDGETISSCKEVLESTLRKYGGAICLVEDKWRIFSFYELLRTPDRTFYTYRGTSFVSKKTTNYPTQTIGSYINNAPIHWVNENQRKEIIPPIGAVKISYEYGFVQSLFANEFLINDGTNVDNWIVSSPDVDVIPNEPGVQFLTADNNDVMLSPDSTQSISAGDQLNMVYAYRMLPDGHNFFTIVNFRILLRIRLTDGINTYSFFDNDTNDNVQGSWVLNGQDYRRTYNLGLQNVVNPIRIDLDLPEAPISGELSVDILRIRTLDGDSAQTIIRRMEISQFAITISTDENLRGECHTQQIEGKNTRVPEVIDTIVGDNFSDVYNGALYEADASTNTQFWRSIFLPLDIVATQPILRILSEFIALYRRLPSYKMLGDAYGYFPYMQIYEFDLIPNRQFMISRYLYDTRNNVVSGEWMELSRGTNLGITYEFSFDFGNAVKPTVIG